MKRLLLLLTLVFAVSILNSGCGGVQSRPQIPRAYVTDISVFYDELSPYGRWFELDDYGYVWSPFELSAGWRPYTNGYWIYTDYGWTWVAQESWGWAAFHYGRWNFHARFGWVWIPDTVWGPAWVVWRNNPGWIGWAPMPPQPGWRRGATFTVFSNPDGYVQPFWYSFVADRNFPDRDLNRRIELPGRNAVLFNQTRNVTNYSVDNNRVINRSIPTAQIEQVTGRRVEERRVVSSPSGAPGPDRVSGSDAIFRRPELRSQNTNRTPPPVQNRPTRPQELQKADTQEKQRLEQQQSRQMQTLEKQHQQELKQTSAQTDRATISRQQETEKRAMQEQHQREQQVLQNRQNQRRQEVPQPTKPASKPSPTQPRKPN